MSLPRWTPLSFLGTERSGSGPNLEESGPIIVSILILHPEVAVLIYVYARPLEGRNVRNIHEGYRAGEEVVCAGPTWCTWVPLNARKLPCFCSSHYILYLDS